MPFGQAFEPAVVKEVGPHFHRFETMATTGLAGGVPVKLVSDRLGHARITITLQIYPHVLPNMREEAEEKVDALLISPNEVNS